MTDLHYTNPKAVTDAKITDTPRSPFVTGYGAKIPTRYMLRYNTKRWHRVYMMQYGNAGSAYILVGGTVHHLDIDTEYRLAALRDGK